MKGHFLQEAIWILCSYGAGYSRVPPDCFFSGSAGLR